MEKGQEGLSIQEMEQFMKMAIEEAQLARQKDEVPVGCIIVKEGKVIARGHNLRETQKNALCHAELIAIHGASQALGGWRLLGCTLFVTLEPCPMCAGAIIGSRIENVVFGAYDPKAGALGSLYDLAEGKLNHMPRVIGGVLEEDCAMLLRDYFREKRAKRRTCESSSRIELI